MKLAYGVYLCDPTPWGRGHDWRIPVFFPLMTSLSPDNHGPWVLPRTDGRPAIDHILHKWTIGNETGYHSLAYFNRRQYRTGRLGKAQQMAAKIRKAHPYLIVRVDEISE